MLLRSVLSSIPIHCLSSLPVPKDIINKLHSLFASFFWNSRDSGRHHWVSWLSICRPVDEGGLGIRDLNQVMNALHAKMAWRFIEGSSLWSQFMRSKYGHPGEIQQAIYC